MNVEKFKEAVVHNVYHIPAGHKVPLHKHARHDEVFYCVEGSGFGVLENSELPLTAGKVFIVPAGTMHALRSDDHLYVTSSLIPLADDPNFAD